ncbi:MAG TPA: ribonuclease HII [Methylothermaceae bacterium]|nr:ribonuclease HII [Methylothermaceae bacterium]
MKTSLTAGVDEVGRGCLVGAVVAAAVILPEDCAIAGLADSKSLSPQQREQLSQEIQYHAIAWATGRAEPSEIDHFNILQCTLLAMQRAVTGLSVRPDRVLVDGRHLPALPMPVEAVIGGDGLVPVISAASIIAKVARDREMTVLDRLACDYGIWRHKGYPTQFHRQQLQKQGPSLWHRYSFAPVKRVVGQLRKGSGRATP